MMDNEGYIWRKRETVEKVKIPEGCVKCPTCKGSGEIRRYYGGPHDKGQYEEKALLEKMRKLHAVK